MHAVNNTKINIVNRFDNKIPKSILEGSPGERTYCRRTFAGGSKSGWETKYRRMPPDGSIRKSDSRLQDTGMTGGRK